MSENKNFEEELQDGTKVNTNLWSDNAFKYITYKIKAEGYSEKSEQEIIKIFSKLSSFGNIPHEYTRQASISEEEENGEEILEITFVLGNK